MALWDARPATIHPSQCQQQQGLRSHSQHELISQMVQECPLRLGEAAGCRMYRRGQALTVDQSRGQSVSFAPGQMALMGCVGTTVRSH